jgi:hypothetical protein
MHGVAEEGFVTDAVGIEDAAAEVFDEFVEQPLNSARFAATTIEPKIL